MKLVLYSGGQSRSNHRLHEAVVKLARKRTPRGALQMTYIPFCADAASVFFHRAIRRYRSHGVERFFSLSVDVPHSSSEIKTALESDIIYLAGGNTFYFLKHLRESGMLDRLKKFAKNGGVLAGLSAGGLIMSPTVGLAADQGLGPDENEVGVRDFRALGLFDFEFSPHFCGTRSEIKAHLNYSLKTPYPIYAAADGGGMIIDGNVRTVCGEAMLFHRGTCTQLIRSRP